MQAGKNKASVVLCGHGVATTQRVHSILSVHLNLCALGDNGYQLVQLGKLWCLLEKQTQYPNIFSDWGNCITVKKRSSWLIYQKPKHLLERSFS